MWDWTHFKNEGWLAHTRRSAKLSVRLLLAGLAMSLHVFVPFWQQPKCLRAMDVASYLRAGSESHKE